MAFFKDLLRRRVPQVFVLYVGTSWGLVQFVDFVTQRYAMSPHLTDLALLLPFLLLPSVLLVTYYHGAPGADEWVLVEKVGVPANLVAAVFVLLFFVRGKDLGAATTVVTVTDEDGVETERVVPKSEFRKRIAFYYFDAEPGDTAAAWLQYGLPSAVVTDLVQDHFIDATSPPLFADRLREAGFMELHGVPLALQREIAEELHRDQFVTGSVAVADGEVRATVGLYDVARGRLVEEHTYAGGDVLELADRIATQLRVDLEIPELGDAAVQDLPTSQVLTTSADAYRSYVEGLRRAQVDRDFGSASDALAAAVEADPTFALAQVALAQVFYMNNRSPEATAPLQAAMDHMYRIPERLRFTVKSDYYFFVRQDVDKALASIDMWAELFPDDVAAFQARVQIQAVRDDRAGMLASLERILELDPNQKAVLLQIGSLHEGMGDLDAASTAFQRYADEFPDSHEPLTRLAGISRAQGDPEGADAYYDRALLLAPSDVGVLVGAAGVKRSLGDFEGAERHLADAEAAAGTPEERARAHQGWARYYQVRGRLAEAVTHLEQRAAEIDAAQPGLMSLQARLFTLPEVYVEAGREADATALVAMVRSQVPPPFDALAAMGEMGIQLAREDADGIEAALPGVQAIIDQLRYEFLQSSLTYARGRVHELRGEYQEALALYEEERQRNPSDTSIPAQLGRCHLGLGDLDRAVELFQESLAASPWAPRTNYQLGLAYEELGRRDDAARHFGRAVEIWADADPGYARAEDARAALQRVSG